MVVGIGLSLGGPTGYAINRTAASVRGSCTSSCRSRKGTSDWGHAFIAVVGPLASGASAGLIRNPAF